MSYDILLIKMWKVLKYLSSPNPNRDRTNIHFIFSCGNYHEVDYVLLKLIQMKFLIMDKSYSYDFDSFYITDKGIEFIGIK